ncbi:MAG: helix-turn-helix domain-containing protein [Dehalococcoidia bacterium]|nr:helix-turn-helix domain-containing protein [Dehalococcoidia bacterium]
MKRSTERSYYTVAEAARFLDVSPVTVWRWIEAQKLQAYRVGPRQIRIREEDLMAMVRPARGEDPEAGGNDARRRAIFAHYDPERARQALARSAGALAGVDRQALLEDLRAEREQDSAGRPA